MSGEGEFPKIDGDVLYASEVNLLNNRSIIGNNYQILQTGAIDYNELDNTFLELYDSDKASSTTNLTYRSDTHEYYSVTAGSYELQTNTYYTESNCSGVRVFFDYAIYKSVTETVLATPSNSEVTTTDISSLNTFIYKYYMDLDAWAGSGPIYMKIKDEGTNEYTLFSYNSSSGGTFYKNKGYIKMFNDTTNKKLYIYGFYEYYYYDPSNLYREYRDYPYSYVLDYSTWGNNLYVGIYGYNSGNSYVKIYYQRSYIQNPTTTATISVSVDGGTTWKNIQNGGFVKLTTAGSQIKAKISGTIASGEGITIKKVILKPVAQW